MASHIITHAVEQYAEQCETERNDAWFLIVLASIRDMVAIRRQRRAYRGRLHRAATRSFGKTYKIIGIDRVRVQNRDFRFSFISGRFYGQ